MTARSDAEKEAQLIRNALASIYEIRTIRNELRLQVGKSESVTERETINPVVGRRMAAMMPLIMLL